MPLVVVNPTPTHKGRRKPKGGNMAKRHRTPAQRAATKRMLAARKHRNPSHSPKRRYRRVTAKHRNPSPIRRATRRRRLHRNPALFSQNGLFGELMSMEGLMMAGVVVAMPTAQEMAVSMIAPESTGYGRVAIKTGVGLAGAFLVDKLVGRKVALIAALIAVGTGVAETIKTYQGVAGYGSPNFNTPSLRGYAARGTLGAVKPRPRLGVDQWSEPGMRRVR